MAHEFEEGPDGTYSVCVFNAEDCSDEKIREVFEAFGEIVRMNRVNNIIFIRYQTLEEAVQCYESMQGDAKFNVKPGRKKNTSNIAGRPKDGQAGEMNRSDNFRGRKSDMGGSGDFNRPNSGGGPRRPPPQLIPFPSVEPAKEGAAKPLPSAKVIVIGNLDPKLGQNNVYDMCTRAQAPPLHVAMKTLKRPPYPNISYALVYVRNEKEAENIIGSFNNLKINGYKLAVSSSEKLSEEGKALLSATG